MFAMLFHGEMLIVRVLLIDMSTTLASLDDMVCVCERGTESALYYMP